MSKLYIRVVLSYAISSIIHFKPILYKGKRNKSTIIYVILKSSVIYTGHVTRMEKEKLRTELWEGNLLESCHLKHH